jgi:cytochrome c oxidase subunit 2
MKLVNKKIAALASTLAIMLLAAAGPALADFELNMTPGVTPISREVYGLHMLILWICVAIGVVVFGAIIYSVIKFRRSKGAVPAQFHHSTTVEIIWTVIPMLILIAMAIPATKVLVAMEDTSDADLTIEVTGYQWRWGYKYLDEDISFISSLERKSNLARQRDPVVDPREVEYYLLEVDEPLVVPINKKIRFLLTSADVIHAWWVPALGWKKDAIPGFINEAWARIEQPGTYRGQCAELCGRDHAFMPVVVKAVTEQEYREWVQQRKAAAGIGEGAAEEAAQAAQEQKGAAPPQGGPFQPKGQAQPPSPGAQPTQAVPPPAQQQGQQQAAPAQQSKDQLMQRGEQAYLANCASCHMANGEGMPPTFAPLKGSPVATGDVAQHIQIVLKGVQGTAMAPFAHLSDEDLAAIITYERNAWGNNTGDLVQPADVRAAR